MSTSEICPTLTSYGLKLDLESKLQARPKRNSEPSTAIQGEYLIKSSKKTGKLLGHSTELVDALPDLVDLGKASKQDFAGNDPAGRETMKTIAGATVKALTMFAIAAGTVAAIGGVSTLLVAPAAAVAAPVVAAAGAAALYLAPSYAEGLARKAIDLIGDGAQAAGKWIKGWL